MSRYRIRGPQSGMMPGDDDDLVYDEFSDDDVTVTGKKLKEDDLDSEDSYEIGTLFVNSNYHKYCRYLGRLI